MSESDKLLPGLEATQALPPKAAVQAPEPKARIKPVDRNQMMMRPVDVEGLIEEGEELIGLGRSRPRGCEFRLCSADGDVSCRRDHLLCGRGRCLLSHVAFRLRNIHGQAIEVCIDGVRKRGRDTQRLPNGGQPGFKALPNG